MTSPIFPADVSSPEMRAAVSLARESFRIFWRELSWEYRRIVPGLEIAAIKMPFSDAGDVATGSDVEHMWLRDLSFDGVEISATLLNAPVALTSVSEGDRIRCRVSEITDWMYSVNGQVCGAFTINAMRAQMDDAARNQHDVAWGLDFGDPHSVRFVPDSFEIKAQKTGMLGRLFGGAKSGSQQLVDVTATEHPMAMNMLDGLKDFAATPANINATDDGGLNYLHSMALAGAASGVDVLVRAGGDGSIKTNHGLTAYALAESMGWPEVMRVLVEHGCDE